MGVIADIEETVPVLPAKSNGCFGYIANAVTTPPS